MKDEESDFSPGRKATWSKSEIDFAFGAKCYFCGKSLKRGIALYLVSPDGPRVPAGPQCAAKHALPSEMPVPDFTKGVLESVAEEGASVAENDPPVRHAKATNPGKPKEEEGGIELEYLRIRVEKLPDFRGVSTPILVGLYTKWKQGNGNLHDDDKRHLRNLAAKMSREKTVYSPENLQNCYAYKCCIERLVAETKSDFPRSLLDGLRTHLSLTSRQIEGLNIYFKNRDMPTLDPMAFQSVKRLK